MLKNILIKTSERIFYWFGFGLGMGTAFKIYPVNKKFYKDASSGVRTHEWFNTKVLKTSPLDLSGILAFMCRKQLHWYYRKKVLVFLFDQCILFFLLYVSFLKYFLRLLLPHSRIELLTSALPRFCVRMTILLAFAYFTYKNGALPTELMGPYHLTIFVRLLIFSSH